MLLAMLSCGNHVELAEVTGLWDMFTTSNSKIYFSHSSRHGNQIKVKHINIKLWVSEFFMSTIF